MSKSPKTIEATDAVEFGADTAANSPSEIENQTQRHESHDGANGDLAARIAVAAYYLAENRGFAAGQELEDWTIAESQILGTNSPPPSNQ